MLPPKVYNCLYDNEKWQKVKQLIVCVCVAPSELSFPLSELRDKKEFEELLAQKNLCLCKAW